MLNGELKKQGLLVWADINDSIGPFSEVLENNCALAGYNTASAVSLNKLQALILRKNWGKSDTPFDESILVELYSKAHKKQSGVCPTSISTHNGVDGEQVVQKILRCYNIPILATNACYGRQAFSGSPCKWDVIALLKAQATVLFIEVKTQCGQGSAIRKWHSAFVDVRLLNGYRSIEDILSFNKL